ncbi:Protein MEI2-like 6 [Linum grandiflorum]
MASKTSSSKPSHPLNPNASPYTLLSTTTAAANSSLSAGNPPPQQAVVMMMSSPSPRLLPHQIYHHPPTRILLLPPPPTAPLSAAAPAFHLHHHRNYVYCHRRTSFRRFHATTVWPGNHRGSVPPSPATPPRRFQPVPEMGSWKTELPKRRTVAKTRKMLWRKNESSVDPRRRSGGEAPTSLPELTENGQSSGGADVEKPPEEEEAVTSLMIRNIPNHFQRGQVMRYLDRHCAVVKNSVAREGGVLSEYDFFYLPMDFSTGANLGYAFVNFTTAVAAFRFRRYFHDCAWGINDSGKICQITDAVIQGREALVANFKKKVFMCHRDYYLPLVFTPPRGGRRPKSVGTMVGHRLSPFPSASKALRQR